MAAQTHKLEVKVTMKSPEKLVSFYINHVLETPKLAPAIIKACETIGGGTQMGPGSVFHVTYILPGMTEVVSAKGMLGDVDEVGGKYLSFTVIEGEMLQKYPTFISRATIVGNEITWTLMYEKADPSTLPPLEYVTLYTLLTQAFDNFNC